MWVNGEISWDDGPQFDRESGDAVVRINYPLSEFAALKIDGNLVAASEYILANGSTVITLKESYLDTLSVGEHTLSVEYNNNVILNSTFEIMGSDPIPGPDDPTPDPDDPTPGPDGPDDPTPDPDPDDPSPDPDDPTPDSDASTSDDELPVPDTSAPDTGRNTGLDGGVRFVLLGGLSFVAIAVVGHMTRKVKKHRVDFD